MNNKKNNNSIKEDLRKTDNDFNAPLSTSKFSTEAEFQSISDMSSLIEQGADNAMRQLIESHHSVFDLPDNYSPIEDEEFMNERQKLYFRKKLLLWRQELLNESIATLDYLQKDLNLEPDLTDRATVEFNRSLELKSQDRARKLIGKIDEALHRLQNGTYGYCEETGEPIGIKRLQARPIATLCIEAQEQHERSERLRRRDS